MNQTQPQSFSNDFSSNRSDYTSLHRAFEQIARIALEERNNQQMVRSIVQVVSAVLKSDISLTLSVPDRSPQQPELIASTGLRTTELDDVLHCIKKALLDGHIEVPAQPILVSDRHHDARWHLDCVVLHHNVAAWAVVPLPCSTPGQQAIFVLFWKAPRIYTDEEISWLRSINRLLMTASSRNQAEAKLHEAAAKTTRVREDILAIVSHELRNPLNVILLNADLLTFPMPHRVVDPATEKYAATIRRCVDQMNRIIGDLLDFSSIQGGRLAIERGWHTIAALVQDAHDLLAPLANEKGLRVEIDLQDDFLRTAEVLCDRDRILQVLGNLLNNAIKFTAKHGTITLRVQRRSEHYCFEVSDTGIGIAADRLPYIFDRYAQAHRSSRKGVGLGLAIARGIVEAHGGTIGVESRESAGSTFFFTLKSSATQHAERPSSRPQRDANATFIS